MATDSVVVGTRLDLRCTFGRDASPSITESGLQIFRRLTHDLAQKSILGVSIDSACKMPNSACILSSAQDFFTAPELLPPPPPLCDSILAARVPRPQVRNVAGPSCPMPRAPATPCYCGPGVLPVSVSSSAFRLPFFRKVSPGRNLPRAGGLVAAGRRAMRHFRARCHTPGGGEPLRRCATTRRA